MRVSALELSCFRNITAAAIEPHSRFNILEGQNGQGKTNLLEALWWLATLRPLRASRLRELVQWGAEGTRVEARVQHEGLTHRLSVAVKGRERIARREDKVARARDYFGALSVVIFTPEDVGLVRGAPEQRRRFLDRAIFTARPAHLADVLAYRRALEGRNALLRAGKGEAFIAAYEGTLAQCAARLVAARRSYIEEISEGFERAFGSIVGEDLKAQLRYRPGLDASSPDDFEAAWAAERSRDRHRGFTQRGPHTDDLVMRMLDRSAKAYASQGQQRGMVLALKIAEIELLEARAQITPVLLLDDVSSELDAERNARLFDFLQSFVGQVFITTTDADFLRIEGPRRSWRIEGGVLGAAKDVGTG